MAAVLKGMLTSFVPFYSGSFTMLGVEQPDATDADKMIATLQSISLIAALQLSFFVPTFQHAATSAFLVDAYWSGVGTVYLLMAFTLVYASFLCCVYSIVAMICLANIQGEADQAFHFISSARGELLMPWRLWIAAVHLMIFVWPLEGYIRINGLDFETVDELGGFADGSGAARVLENLPGGAWRLDRLSNTSVAFLGAWFCFEMLGFLMLFTMVSKARTSHEAFMPREPEARKLETTDGGEDVKLLHATSIATSEPQWYADLDSAEIRQLLTSYLKSYSPSGSISPLHFQRFVTAEAQHGGHQALSYLSTRKVDSIFEQYVQQHMQEEAVMIRDDEMLHGMPFGSLLEKAKDVGVSVEKLQHVQQLHQDKGDQEAKGVLLRLLVPILKALKDLRGEGVAVEQQVAVQTPRKDLPLGGDT